jgi:hypothetical protein
MINANVDANGSAAVVIDHASDYSFSMTGEVVSVSGQHP